MKIGVIRERMEGETRVALVPRDLPLLIKKGFSVLMESGAGERAGYPDELYRAQGGEIVRDPREVYERADLILRVRSANADPEHVQEELSWLKGEKIIVGFMEPLANPAVILQYAERGATLMAMELIPRITRAQVMDALSAMASIAGYRAVLIAAQHLPRFFPMLTTAAGTIPAGRVFVLGAGVAGLMAIATARRLGAVVEAYDVRSAVKEQVQSVGGKFLELGIEPPDAEDKSGYARALSEEFYARQRELFTQHLKTVDAVITTAAVPGKPAPKLITEEMVAGMKWGSVIVDLAAERGGNCTLTQPGKTIVHKGVTIIGPLNLPATLPEQASQMYSRNLSNLLQLLARGPGEFSLPLEDEIIRGIVLTREGKVIHPALLSNALPQG
jgi:NAD(P) transhydrogenase subunit alpha